MGCHPGAQCVQFKVWPLVYEVTILGAQRDVVRQPVIDAASVDRGWLGLRLRARHESACLARGIKNQGTGTGKNVGLEPENAVREW